MQVSSSLIPDHYFQYEYLILLKRQEHRIGPAEHKAQINFQRHEITKTMTRATKNMPVTSQK